MAETDGPGDFAGFEGLDGGDGSSIEGARTEAIERLKRHAAPGGALSAAELADRVRRVYLAQTRVGIDQVLAGLPADPPWSLAPGLPPVPGQAPVVRQRRPPTTPWRRLGFVLGALVLLVGVGAAAVVASTGDDEDAGEPDEEEADGPARQLPECAWERATDFTFGLEGDIIDYAYPAAPDPSVQVQAGERFTSMTCGTWTRA